MYKHNRTAKQKAYESSIQSAVGGNIHPVHAYGEITRECNLSCAYCVERHRLINNDMGLEEWKRASDIAYTLGNRSFGLLGGETLLSPHILDLVDYISSRDTFVSITTNGHYLNEDILHALDEAGLDNLIFSIDSLEDDAKPHFGKNLTPKLERTLRSISASKFKFKTNIAAVMMKDNLPILPEMLRFFSGLGMPIRFHLVVIGALNQTYMEKLALGEEDLYEVERVIEKLLEMKSDGYLLGNEDYFFTRLRPKMGACTPAGIYQMYLGDSSPHNCKGGVYDLPMMNDGLLAICCSGLTSSTHIFDLNSIEDYHAYINQNRKVTGQCKCCALPHKWGLTHLEETGGFKELCQSSTGNLLS